MAEIDYPRGVAHSPVRCAARLGSMSCVGAARRKAAPERLRQRVIADRSGETAVPNSLEATVPSFQRQPYFKFDIGTSRRSDLAGHSAKGRQGLEGCRAAPARTVLAHGCRFAKERPCRNRSSIRDHRMLKLQRRQVQTGVRVCRNRRRGVATDKRRERRQHKGGVCDAPHAIQLQLQRLAGFPLLSRVVHSVAAGVPGSPDRSLQ